MSFELGTTVGDYEFLDILESNKSGVSYKVRNTVAERYEVLKVLPKALQEDQERVERFVREVKVHARLQHPNIVTFFNATQLGRQMVMTTELVEGMTLKQLLELGPLLLGEVVLYIGQALDALDYAHGQGVVHREITPSNIIVTPDGTVKLRGFELAKAASDPKLTQAGTVVGELAYISPEQVKGVTDLDGRADLYSLGVVLYEAVTGQPPFESKSQFDLMLAHVNQLPPEPAQIKPDLPVELNAIILKALAKDPAQRFQTARQFRMALGRVPVEKPAAAAVIDEVQPQLPPLQPESPAPPEPADIEVAAPPVMAVQSGWRTPQLMVAAIVTFIVMAVAFFAILNAVKL